MTDPMLSNDIDDNPFGDPIDGNFIGEDTKIALEGALVAVEVIAYDPDRPTKVSKPGKKSPCVEANVFVLDGELKGESWEDTVLYGAALPMVLKKYAGTGKPVLGRWIKGEANPAFPKFRPWTLQKVTDNADDLKVGKAWFVARKAELEAREGTPFA